MPTYSGLAVVVPFLAAVTLGLGEPEFRGAFAGLAVLGLAVLAATFRLSRALQADLDALVAAVNPEAPLLGFSISRYRGKRRP